ncbi:hypothetical protein [Pedobacter sp.]
MTAIVGVLNSQGIAIAADSAVTVSGNNIKKVYNRSNKIFTLSKFHPVGIAIYNSADYLGMPLETLIKMYRKKLQDNSFDTLEEYKNDFIEFLRSQIGNITPAMRESSFFGFCSEAHWEIINNTIETLEGRPEAFEELEEDEAYAIYHQVVGEEIDKYSAELAKYKQANYTNMDYDTYCKFYENQLLSIVNFIETEIDKEFEGFTILADHAEAIRKMLFSLINIEYIFEKHCGLVFIGFGEMEMYPSSHLVLAGTLIGDDMRIIKGPPVKINPGVPHENANIIPYAQGDVTTTVLTGVDPNYKSEVKQAIKSSFGSASSQIEGLINDTKLSKQIGNALETISNELIDRLEAYQWEKITRPLLEILAHMGKEDMSDLAESLVNITSLKRKFTSSDSADESVGGPVDVAIITKGDGFIWMKRKHYFDIENNQAFRDKYFKI